MVYIAFCLNAYVHVRCMHIYMRICTFYTLKSEEEVKSKKEQGVQKIFCFQFCLFIEVICACAYVILLVLNIMLVMK